MSENKLQLSNTEQFRYSQQLKLENVGLAGQIKLKNARVLCIGAGGLGSPMLLYLAAAGIGTIGIVDNDTVEINNLQRQVLYQTSHISKQKVRAAKEQLTALNPHIEIKIFPHRLSIANAAELITQFDIIADCTDNFATRYLINDICFQQQKPFVSASITKFEGQCALFQGSEGPCYRCLFPEPPTDNEIPNCNDGGVFGVLPGLLGVIQATEILKWILQIGDPLSRRLLTLDALNMHFREFILTQNPDCDLCIHKKSFTTLTQPEVCYANDNAISAQELRETLKNNPEIILLDVRSPQEHTQSNLGGKLIPLPELTNRLHELDPQKNIITYCQSGPRSIRAVKILTKANFKQVKYLRGGVEKWSREVE